ncbi:MAG: SxtJ family membrane protein, partial [Gammaproteobacteria bacterium]
MQLSNNILELDRTGLQKFGLLTGAIIACLFGIAIPWLFNIASPYWPWILSVLLVIWAILAPLTLKPVYRLWMRFGLLMNRISTPIILGIVFFLIIAPMGMFMRIIGRDSMTRKFNER